MKLKTLREIIKRKEAKSEFAIVTNLASGESEIFEKDKPLNGSFEKYRKQIGKKGMLGIFIIPFFIINMFLGLVGLSIFFYLTFKRIYSNIMLTKYSIIANTPIITLDELFITPSILNYLGIVLFFLGFLFIILIMAVLKEKILKKENILNIPFYLIFYLILYPFIMINAIWHYSRNKKIWR